VTLGYDGGLHADLRVANLDRALAWYRDVLEWTARHARSRAGFASRRSTTPTATTLIIYQDLEQKQE
jgi:predicted enzyme related to lactoylglutathione lyase